MPEDNFHFTLKFLGSVEESQLDSISKALSEAVRLFPRFTISAKRLGVFPDLKRARVLWVGLEADQMPALARSVETVLETFGFPRESRIFRPHLTVGRWRHPNGSHKELGDKLKHWNNIEFGESVISELILFQSVLKPTGAVYRPLKTFRLADG